jgi:hypothetical protein
VAKRQQQPLIGGVGQRGDESTDGGDADCSRIGARQQREPQQVGLEQRTRAHEAFCREHRVDQREVVALAVDLHANGLRLSRDVSQGNRTGRDQTRRGAGNGRFDEAWKDVVGAGGDRQQRGVAPAEREGAIGTVAAERQYGDAVGGGEGARTANRVERARGARRLDGVAAYL